MKKYSAFQIPFFSFYSTDLYREACFNWKGTGFAYLFVLLTVTLIPAMLKFHAAVTNFTRNECPQIISQIPQITFVNGTANVDVPQPYSIIDPKTQKVLFVIDTTGKINSLKETSAVGLVTKTEAIIKKNDIQTQTYNFKNFDHFVLNQQKITGWLEIIRKYASLVVYPFMLAGSFIYRIIQLLIYAAIGALFTSLLRSKLPYDALLRLSAVAVTPGIIINVLLNVAGIRVPFAGLCFFLLAMVYLYLGVRESAKAGAQTVGDSETWHIPEDPKEEK